MADSEIHYRDMFLTLDYLLNYTDEEHPASKEDICRHGAKFGLKFDSKRKKGNDIKRERIARCIGYLKKLTNSEQTMEKVPFILATVGEGHGERYYIDQKHYLSKDQILKILAAVKNDKYTQDEDTGFLVDRLLDSLASVHQREEYKKELEKLNRNVKKYGRNLRLVNKAFQNGYAIKLRWETQGWGDKEATTYDIWYRVYKVLEYRLRPYAVLLPISSPELCFFRATVFRPIESLPIPSGGDAQVLKVDPVKNRDLKRLYAEVDPDECAHYGSIDRMIEANIVPQAGGEILVSFWFDLSAADLISESFSDFFSRKLCFIPCANCDVVEEKKGSKPPKEGYLRPHPLGENEKPLYGVATVSVNQRAFQSWMLSDPQGYGVMNIASYITVAGPKTVNEHIADFYVSRLLTGYKRYIGESYLETVIARLREKD